MGVRRTIVYAIGAMLAAVLFLSGVPMPYQRISMLDVEQGDSLLFQRGHVQILVDGGPGSHVLSRLSEEMPFFDRTIELMVATHFDRDHIEGLTHVLNQYRVAMVLIPRDSISSSDLKQQFLRLLEEKNIPYRFAWYGQRITTRGFSLRVLSPIPGAQWERISRSKSNNASIVIRLDAVPDVPGARPLSFLLTGDAEAAVENQLLASVEAQALDTDVLKVGHHGSKTSTGAAFVQAASPLAALVSVGEGNSYGHPTETVLERLRGMPVLRTDMDGTVRFTYTGASWSISCGGKTDLRFWQELCMKNE